VPPGGVSNGNQPTVTGVDRDAVAQIVNGDAGLTARPVGRAKTGPIPGNERSLPDRTIVVEAAFLERSSISDLGRTVAHPELWAYTPAAMQVEVAEVHQFFKILQENP
jgi:hypothetical protein